MASGVTISAASLEDLPRVIEMKLAMFADAGRSTLLAPGIENAIRTDYEDLYAKDLARHFLARTTEGIVASVGAFLKSDLPFRYLDPPTTASLAMCSQSPRIGAEALPPP